MARDESFHSLTPYSNSHLSAQSKEQKVNKRKQTQYLTPRKDLVPAFNAVVKECELMWDFKWKKKLSTLAKLKELNNCLTWYSPMVDVDLSLDQKSEAIISFAIYPLSMWPKQSASQGKDHAALSISGSLAPSIVPGI